MKNAIHQFYEMLDRGEPLRHVAAAARASDMSGSQKAIVALRGHGDPKTLGLAAYAALGELFGISPRAVSLAKQVKARVDPDVWAAIEAGHLTLYSARREIWERAMTGEESPKSNVTLTHRWSRQPSDKHVYTRLQAVEAVADALDGLGHVLQQTGAQLHPLIAPDEAAQALARITGSTKYLSRLKTLLKERADDHA